MNELKPCPFCGGEAEIIGIKRKAFRVLRVNYGYVKCKVCRASTSVCDDEAHAIEAWNRRKANP